MSLVHYKFKSSLDYQNVKFDGLHISVGDLKKEIIAQKHLKLGDFELEISNAQTGSVYKNNSMLIPKNSSVIVSRVPAKPCQASSTQKSWEAYKQEVAKAKEQERQQLSLEQLKQTPDLANANASEIDKVMAAVAQSNRGFEPSNYAGKYHVHESYVCKGCGQSGHHIRNCPSKPEVLAPHIKRTTGIPHSFLTYVDDPMTPGALMTHRGQFAVPTIDAQAYKEGKKELPPFMPIHKGSEPEKPQIPKELKCRLCSDLLTDAVVIPCCGNSYCDECIRDKLLETEDHRCPTCGQYGVSPNGIIPNNHLRSAVMAFTNDSGYSKTRRKSLDSKASVLQSSARLRLPAQQPLYSQASTNHQVPGEGQEHHRPAREQRRPAQSPAAQTGTYANNIDAAHRETARRQSIPSASSSAGHIPPTQSSSLGHLSQSSSSTSHLSATPPMTPHHHTTVAYSEPQRARAEAPPVYVSSTLTSADAASLYSSPEMSAALGTYESDKEQMVNIAGAAVSRHVPREHERYRSGEDHHHHHHHHTHLLPSAADLAYPPPHTIPTASSAPAPLVYHQSPYPAMAAQPPAYLYPSLGIPVYPAGYSTYAAAIPQPVPAQKRDVFDDFAKDIMEKKPDRTRSIRSPSHLRARSYTPRRSRTRSRSRMRSRSRSFKGRSRSASSRRSRLRSYSRGRSGSPRRSASRGRSPGLKSRSPGRARSPGKPRSPGRRSRSRGKSLTPIKRSRSLEKRSRSPTGKFRSPRKSSRSPGHRSPGRRSPGGRSPGRRSPVGRSPGRRSPGVRSPGIRSPGRRSPGARSPVRRSPGVRSPGRRSPGARSPERSPGARSPGRRSPGRRSSLRRSPGARSPGRRSPIGRSPGRRSPVGRSPLRRSPGRRSIGRRSRSFSRRRSLSLGRRRSRSPRSWSYRSPASRRRSFTPRRHRSFSRSRSRGTLRRSHTPHSRSRSWSTPRRKSYSVSPHRITKPLSPLRLGASIRQRSASPFHRRSASPGGFVRRGMTPPQTGFQPFRGRGRGRGFRGRGAYRGDWPPVQHRQFDGRRQFNDQQFDSRQQYNNQFPQVPSSEELLRQQYDAYYRDYYAKFGPNAPPPPPFQAAANSQWNLNQVFQDGRPNQFPPSVRGGLHFQPRPPLLQLGWHQQQLQQHPVVGQQPHPQPLFPEHRQLPADVRARSAEPQPPGVDQPTNRRDFQHEFTREREQGRELHRENSRDFPRDDRNRDSRNSRNYRDEQPKGYDRDQGRDYNRDSDRGYSRDAVKDDQTREYSKDSRDQDKGHLREYSRDHKRDYRDNRERVRDNVRDHVHDRRHTSDSRERHRVSSEKERKSKEKHGKEKKKTEKGTVEEKDKSKKKALKRVSSSDEKTPVPAKKSKKMKTADGTVQQPAESSKKVLAKKKKKTDKKGTTEADTALENNLLQVTVTKSEKIDKISSGSDKEKNKKVVRKVKKVKAAQPIAEGKAAISQPVELETVKTELEPAVSAVDARVVQKEPADSTVAVKDEVESDFPLTSQKTESSQGTVDTTPSKEDLVIVEVCTEMAGDSGLKGDTEDELMLHPPELSKWEREDFDWDISDTTRPPKKVARIPDKVISMLPRSVLNRAETYMAKKPVKPTVSTPPGAKPQRRVYLEEKVEVQPEEKEERLVKTTKTSALEMQITVTKSDKRSPERSAKQERLGEDSRSVVRSSHIEDRSHNHRKRHTDDRYPSGDSSRHHRDSGSPRRESQDRRYRDREDYYHRSSRERDDHLRDKGTRISRIDQGRSEHRDRAVETSRDRKQIGGKSPPRDLRQKLEQSRGHPTKEPNAVKLAQRALDRKESVIDESKFVPDYIEIEETSDSSDEGTAAESQLTLSTEETSDVDGNLAKKVLDGEDGKKKHKKEKKHKKDKKNKKKKKKKDKKHKKDKDKKEKTE